jgi:predicted HTH transcriptional regulator
MIENAEITAGEIAESISITKRRVESNIGQLKALGLVERVGARKNGKWVIKMSR